MSASEKLKALGGLTLKNEHGVAIKHISLGEQLQDALPKLVAVLEAAEITDDGPNLDGGTYSICKICGFDINWKDGPHRGPTGHGLNCALAALEIAIPVV